MKAFVKDTPIIILSGLDDERAAVEAIQMGAQDFLVKDFVTGERLSRVIQFALKRQELQKDPGNTGFMDTLTGLYNKEGFLKAAEPYLKHVQRMESEFFLCCAVLNNFERIKAAHGDGEGERSILTVAEIFRESFRSADIIGRIGTDKFAILATVQPNHDAKSVGALIQQNQKFYNTQFNHYALALSISTHQFSKRDHVTMELLTAKMNSMFENYKTKKNPGFLVES
jgi:diguanylate cyclase (GGDEF)-like protein